MRRTNAQERLSVEQWDTLPESKLELIGGRLIAGNSLAGSRHLLATILRACGPRAALPFASGDYWREALATAYGAPPSLAWPGAWERWTAELDDKPRITDAGPHFSWQHHRAYSLLLLSLYRALREDQNPPLGRCIQRFAMRLGDNGFTPDLQVFRRDGLHRLHNYYVDGPAAIVIEVVLTGHEAQDREVKARLYAAGGVPEYWLIDPVARRAEILTLTSGRYLAQRPGADGRYRSTALPGLVLDPARLWVCLDDPHERYELEQGIVSVEPTEAIIAPSTASNEHEGWSWEWRPYTPPVGLRPTPISFDQFIDWCPEAKFELNDGLPEIGGWEGTRKVLGLLLMTFGLVETVTLLHPREWVAALRAEEAAHRQDAARRDAWWARAHQAAALLRERFGVAQVVVLGDLVRPTPLHFWSELTLVVSGLADNSYAVYTALCGLGDTPEIALRRIEELSPRQLAALATEGHLLHT